MDLLEDQCTDQCLASPHFAAVAPCPVPMAMLPIVPMQARLRFIDRQLRSRERVRNKTKGPLKYDSL